MYKILTITLILLFIGTAAASSNTYTLHQINTTHWYFETNQTDLTDGTYNYTIFANNVSGEYRVLYIDTSTPSASTSQLLTSGFEASLSIATILPIVTIVIAIFSILAVLFIPTSKMDFGAIGTAVMSVIVLIVLLYLATVLCSSIANA